MRRPRARRRTLDPRARAFGPLAALVVAASLAGGFGGPVVAAIAAGAAIALAWRLWSGERRRLRAETLDVDAAVVGRALQTSRGASDEERRLILSASHSVRESTRRTLRLVRASLRATSAVVLWSRSRSGTVQIREAETSSDHLQPGEFGSRDGILGLIGRGRDVAVLADTRTLDNALPWYTPGHEPTTAVAAALVRDGIQVGTLVVDRTAEGAPFDDVDAIAVQAAAEQISLAIHMEHLVLEATTAQWDIQALTSAAATLNAALTAEDVCARALDLLRQFAPIEDMVVTSLDPETDAQTVIFAHGPWVEAWDGYEFPRGECLASRVARAREALPFSGRAERGTAAVLGDKTAPTWSGLLVFPLMIGPGVLGTLTIGNRDPAAFDGIPRTHVALLTHQISAALTNALAYGRMVKAATTDGMTGLTNHRTFKERAALALARAARSGRPVSLLMTDIDHFKKVNDTHGHAAGDQVIKAVAQVLASSARTVDIVARYGGEEFAILLEDADLDAAVVIANRIREAVKQLRFPGAHGPFSVSISLGAARYERGELGALIEEADQALYAAKRGGRDRVCTIDGLPVAAE